LILAKFNQNIVMKKLSLLLLIALLATVNLQAQLSASECMEEVKKVYVHIDHDALLAGDQQVQISMKHSYIMRLDTEGKLVEMEETKIIGHQFYSYDCAEFTDASDATEAFSYRKHQFIIYRTKAGLAKAAVLPEIDKGLFAMASIKECAYIPILGNDTLRHKRALLTITEEGQKRYKVKDMELVWNPKTSMPVSISLNFTEKSLWKWTKFEFHSIAQSQEPMAQDIKAIMFNETGELKPRFKGAEILDYR
jgi:hypothetical protein